MPSRRSGGGTTRRKHSLGNLRRAHPASGATWNVQVVRGKMSSKCLWHACRALVLGLTLMLVGAGMATLGYYAEHLSTGSEIRGNATIRVKNDLKGFHLNNFSYVGPIIMGIGGFIVVASCVMTFEARDSAAKVVPARLRAGVGSKMTVRSNQSSSASQRRAIGMQLQSSRWDQQFGVFRSSPAEPPIQQPAAPFDRDALTAELIKFSKSLSASARFSPQLRLRVNYTGSVPDLSNIHLSSTDHHHPLAYSTNITHLLSPNHKSLLLLEHKRHPHRHHQSQRQSHHRHHHHHHHHHQQQQQQHNHHQHLNSSGRQVKSRGTRMSNSLIQRTTRDNTCTLLQPPPSNRLYWHAASFDESGRGIENKLARHLERTKRSDTAKRHVLARQKPIEHEEDKTKSSPLGNRRSSTMSDSSYSGRCIQVDLHSPEVVLKSILRSPKRYSSGPSNTPSVEREFRSQLSVCSEPPTTTALRQLSGQSSLEPCFPEESIDIVIDEKITTTTTDISKTFCSPNAELQRKPSILKKARPDTLPLAVNSNENINQQLLHRSSSSRTFYRPKAKIHKELDDSIFYIKSIRQRQAIDSSSEIYDSLQVINERRTTLLKAASETASLEERKLNSSSSVMCQVLEDRIETQQRSTSIIDNTNDDRKMTDEVEPPELRANDDTNRIELQIESNEANETTH